MAKRESTYLAHAGALVPPSPKKFQNENVISIISPLAAQKKFLMRVEILLSWWSAHLACTKAGVPVPAWHEPGMAAVLVRLPAAVTASVAESNLGRRLYWACTSAS